MPESSTVLHTVWSSPVRAIRVDVVQGPDRGKSASGQAETITVGTSPDSDLVLTDETVSRYHLELRHFGDRIMVEDLGSTNGTAHGKAMIERASLLPGATLQLGRTALKVEDGDPVPIELHGSDEFFGIRGRSEVMRKLMARIERAAKADVSILLLGETGVGKEVVASAIHRASARARSPFETVDCGALAPTLIASELFGHERGAFTGADQRHIGAFERAEGGTLFLDEIGELPASLQSSLLGVLERRSFRRVGGDKPISVDVRLVCATNRDLRADVNSGAFRGDLYYRIAVLRVDIPALRDRAEDLPVLIEHFLREAGFDGTFGDVIPQHVLDEMMQYRWPGNVRELRNFVDAALAMGETPRLESHAAPSVVDEPGGEAAFPTVPLRELLQSTYKDARNTILTEFEALYLRELLTRSQSNVSLAARMAEIHRTYLIEMLKRHGLR